MINFDPRLFDFPRLTASEQRTQVGLSGSSSSTHVWHSALLTNARSRDLLQIQITNCEHQNISTRCPLPGWWVAAVPLPCPHRLPRPQPCLGHVLLVPSWKYQKKDLGVSKDLRHCWTFWMDTYGVCPWWVTYSGGQNAIHPGTAVPSLKLGADLTLFGGRWAGTNLLEPSVTWQGMGEAKKGGWEGQKWGLLVWCSGEERERERARGIKEF